MGFLIFIWNCFARLVSFSLFIILELFVFGIVFAAVSKSSPAIASLLMIIFVIWVIVEIIIRIFVGTSINIVKYIFGRFF